ncbi:MAG TPA: SUMF1/EgtB/PvdO family nonheme iron enzyme [Polyangiaceae bacterium]|nr:SUMF1/EgtB/PvdO family nonheme iron enzyme [Polyangiaceae bacterium]
MPQRNAHWAMLFVVAALLLSGATRPREVAARSQAGPGASPTARALLRSTATDASPISMPAEPARAALLNIAAGTYLPFYKGKGGTTAQAVSAFAVTARPVTQQDFLRFVQADPRWRRSRVERLFAEASYLQDWSGDLNPGAAPLTNAVTRVSWFAAKAYCASVGMRLPTTIEWERALSVVGTSFVESARARASATLAASLWEWTADFNAVPLADGDSNDSVATLFCGAGVRARDASDYGAFLRYSFRSSLKADFALKNLGFRCAEGPS